MFVCIKTFIFKRLHFLVALHSTSTRATVNFIWIKLSCFFLVSKLIMFFSGFKLWFFSGFTLSCLFWFQNLSSLCAVIWNQFSEENQLRVESHWKESWVVNEGRVWSADASFRFVDEEDTNQDDSPQCLRMSFPPVEEWARVASKCCCRSRILLFTGGMETRGLDTCLQQVFWWVGMLK